ncbi:nucleoside triphosphate pyrophosphohydrolase [Companilactobacillus mishanensis]|uniref:Nucleotide pyrophosphohydrolase n=1 Tax=Companilactobacillus mishanensis TaxID=2486008 RepID=A0A5P0ZHU5_9LACO|nr:nucleoside triphosphate pyrophosphohydrolase [Companilactobacillus mishanensis]MQS45136.1 nucleotide pyrophosphohydrolase [Companilactobacillus mishanensis]MQS52609.1 nucleotide pyrophosphohydrolase [Companilactobacillus mishanensis]MQS90199.1 nucleotide pyrophosphohydrolase [Companilactobacillus mishanensis]
MEKLVRNKIPNIVGDKAEFETLSNEKYRIVLRDKLVEEAKEVKKADSRANLVEELGDLEEVMRAILDDASITYEEMDSIRQSKNTQKGNFSEKIVMITDDDPQTA